MTTDYIIVSKEFVNSWMWDSPLDVTRWQMLLFLAETKKTEVKFKNLTIAVNKGEIITTSRRLMHYWQTNGKTMLGLLDRLKSQGMIEVETTTQYTKITILNFDKYTKVEAKEEVAQKQQKPVKEIKEKQPKIEEENLVQMSDVKESEEKGCDNINNIYNTYIQPSIIPGARAREEDYISQCMENDSFKEKAAMALSVSVPEVEKLMAQFASELDFFEKEHESLSDFKYHFINWSKIQIKNKTNKNGNTKSKTSDREQRAIEYANAINSLAYADAEN